MARRRLFGRGEAVGFPGHNGLQIVAVHKYPVDRISQILSMDGGPHPPTGML